jgi:hypothetical protein
LAYFNLKICHKNPKNPSQTPFSKPKTGFFGVVGGIFQIKTAIFYVEIG